MCVICAKARGVARPTNKQIDAMIASNPHGFGLATFENGQIIVRKTMDASVYKQWATAVPNDVPAIFHMRIATHGSINELNCHPFLSDDKQWAFAHNGVLGIQNEGDMTDSETFFKRLAMPMIHSGHLPHDKDGVFDRMVDCIIGSSKFVFMNNKGNIIRYGNWIEDGGLFFSNSSYQPVLWDDYFGMPITSGKSRGVNSIGSDEYYELVEDLSSYFMYEPNPYDCTTDELYQSYKQTYPKLKRKVFVDACSEAMTWCEESSYYGYEDGDAQDIYRV